VSHNSPTVPQLLDAIDIAECVLDLGKPYIVVVVDAETESADAYGPLDGPDAIVRAEKFRREFESEQLAGITVQIVKLHPADE
jgi:hypothetical protein